MILKTYVFADDIKRGQTKRIWKSAEKNSFASVKISAEKFSALTKKYVERKGGIL